MRRATIPFAALLLSLSLGLRASAAPPGGETTPPKTAEDPTAKAKTPSDESDLIDPAAKAAEGLQESTLIGPAGNGGGKPANPVGTGGTGSEHKDKLAGNNENSDKDTLIGLNAFLNRIKPNLPPNQQGTLDKIGNAIDAIINADKPATPEGDDIGTENPPISKPGEVNAPLTPAVGSLLKTNVGDIATILSEVPGSDPELQKARIEFGGLANRYGSAENPQPFESTLKVLAPVLRADPDNQDALNQHAISNYGLGRYREAVEDSSRVIGRNSEDERAYTTRALAYYQIGEYAQANEDAKLALHLNPNNTVARNIFRDTRDRVTRAEDLGLNPAQLALAQKLQRQSDARLEQRGRIEAGTVVPEAPGRAAEPVRDALLNAKRMVKIGDLQGAYQKTSQLLERHPDSAEALAERAAIENLRGQHERAVADADSALARDPQNAAALDARIRALLALNRHAEARADSDRLIALKPKDALAYKNRALAREGLGDYAGMLADLERAARLSPLYDEELKAAASKYNLALGGRSAAELAVAGEAQASRRAPSGRRLWVVLALVLMGGVLVALGLFHALRGERAAAPKIEGAGTETAAAIASGGRLAGYEIQKTIGQGGMGVVYAARDKALDRKVAIKKMREEIRDNPRERERFLQEARIVARLHHPNIVDIHSILEDAGELYMVFEFVEGSSVDHLLAKKQRFTIPEAVLLCRGVCRALAYAHHKGVIHRDLKPSNVMVTRDGMVKVMDFGIARQAKDALAASTRTNTVAGTPLYMAPEQEQGIVRKESDLFALTACFYELITGTRPFPAPSTTANKLAKRYEKPSRVTAGLPPEVDAFIDAGLEPDPDKRIHSAEEFEARLAALTKTGVSA